MPNNTLIDLLKLRSSTTSVIEPLLNQWMMKGEDRPYLHPKVLEYTRRSTTRWSTKGRFAASTAGGCQRKGVLLFNGVEAPRNITPRSQRYFDNGYLLHLRWHSYLLWMSEDPDIPLESLGFEQEVNIPGWWVRGTLDHKIRVGQETFVVDFKSMNPWYFSNLSKTGALAGHVRQIVIYLKAEKIRKGIILYENKATQEVQEFVIDLDRELLNKSKTHIRRMQSHVRAGTVPDIPRECKAGEYEGKLCRLKNYCYPDPEED